MIARPGSTTPSKKRAARRQAQKARREGLSIRPMPEAIRQYDPLRRKKYGAFAKFGRVLVVSVAAALAHGLILGAIFGASAVARAITGAKPEVNEPIEVAIVENTPPPPPEPPAPAPVEPEAEKAEEKKPEPKKPEPKKAEPKVVEKAPPPLDPTNKPKTDEPPKQNPSPARRVVGLNLESTTEGGSGPSFGTGNTRMGETEKKAANPNEVAPAEKTVGTPNGTGQGTTENRVATRIPTAGVKIVRAAQKDKVKADYPESFRQRGIEADVVVRVSIDPNGVVTEVVVVAPCEYPELNEAAKAAALRQTWAPETRDGVAAPSKATYTYQFRVNG